MKKSIKDSNDFSQMERRIIKITFIIHYMWIGIGAAKPSHKSKGKQEILRKKMYESINANLF